MPTSTKCQKIKKKMTINVIQHVIGYDIYDCFTMEHFRGFDDQNLLLATVHTSLNASFNFLFCIGFFILFFLTGLARYCKFLPESCE
jgi:hypothetical protein